MKNEETLIKKNGFGQLSFCKECSLFYLKFSSVLIELTRKEFRAFHLIVKDIDTNYWERLKQIPHVPIGKDLATNS